MSVTCICLGSIDALQLQVLLRAGVHVGDASLQRQLPGTFPLYEPPQRRHQHPEIWGLQGAGIRGRVAGTRVRAVFAEAKQKGQHHQLAAGSPTQQAAAAGSS